MSHVKPKPDVRRRAQHLAFVRQLPCVAYDSSPSEAAYVHSGSDGGAGMKPSDRYFLSLCAGCHVLQHRFGELTFWSALRIDPLNVALRLRTVSGDYEAGKRNSFGRNETSSEDCCQPRLKSPFDQLGSTA